MMLAIINADIVMRDYLIPNGYVIVEDGLIKDIEIDDYREEDESENE